LKSNRRLRARQGKLACPKPWSQCTLSGTS
jgi:hypothetical protein